MSDGHFNKCFLPHNQFQSGLRAGKTQLRMKAVAAFRRFLDEMCPGLDETERENRIDSFRKELEDTVPNTLERTKQ